MVALEQVFGVTGAQLYGLEPLPHPEDTEPQIQLHETALPHWLAPASYFIGMDGGGKSGGERTEYSFIQIFGRGSGEEDAGSDDEYPKWGTACG